MKVLVTNASSAQGRALVTALGPDTVSAELTTLERPRALHDLLYGRALGVETVLHDSPDPEHARHLVLACEHHPTIRRFVYRSSSEVYLRTAREPNLLDEDAPLDFERAAADLTICARIGTSPLSIAVLRCAELLVPGSELCDYLGSRVCLRPAGFDPMINVLSIEDHVEAHLRAARSPARGVFNIPGADTLPLSRMIARAGRRDIPVPGPLLAPLYQLRTRLVGFEFRYDRNMRRFHFGGILDGSRARTILGYTPHHPLDFTAAARFARTRRPSAGTYGAVTM